MKRFRVPVMILVALIVATVTVTSQIPPDEVLSSLLVRDSTGFHSLANVLADDAFRDEVGTGFATGVVTSIEFQLFFVAPDGDRLYRGALGFGQGFSTGRRTHLLYLHDAANQPPLMPPDIVAFRSRSQSPPVGSPVLIPSLLAYDFLTHVLQDVETSASLIDELDDGPLVGLRLEEEHTGGVSNFTLFLEYRGSASFATEKIVVVTGFHETNIGFYGIEVN